MSRVRIWLGDGNISPDAGLSRLWDHTRLLNNQTGRLEGWLPGNEIRRTRARLAHSIRRGDLISIGEEKGDKAL